MTTEEIDLCIGGPFDGECKPKWRTTGRFIHFPILTDRGFGPSVTYRREIMRANDAEFMVWVEDTMSLKEAMQRLLLGYRPRG